MFCGAQGKIGELVKETVRGFNTVPYDVNVGQISFHQLITRMAPRILVTLVNEAKPVDRWNPTLPSHQ